MSVKKHTEPKTKKFRLAARKFFLTYARTKLTPQDVLDQLSNIFVGKAADIERYVITSEEHETQQEKGHHIHVYIKLNKKLYTKIPTFFDLKDKQGQAVHGNYQGCRSVKDTIDYITKDVFDYTNREQVILDKYTSRLIHRQELLDVDSQMIKLAEKGLIKEAMLLLKQEKPAQYIKSHKAIEKSFQGIFLKEQGATVKYDLKDYTLPTGLLDKMDSTIHSSKTPMLVGGSGTGKSHLVKTYLYDRGYNSLVINNLDGLRFFDASTHNCLILDDVDLTSDRERLIKIIDSEEECTLSIKHGSVRIPANTLRFIVSNKPMDYYNPRLADLPEIRRRFMEIHIKGCKLFSTAKHIDKIK